MSEQRAPLLLLVDGSSFLFRAYHAMPPLTNSRGQATGAIFGVINMLRKLLVDYSPAYCAVVFDSKESTFRHQLFPQYKANRPEMAEDLQSQIKPLHQIIQSMGIPLLIARGYEADDVIGTLAIQASKMGYFTLIATGDKDFSQIVCDNIHLINTMANAYYDPAAVEKKFGIPPSLFIDYLMLIGDTSDNIPGVNKVGPKTAEKWLKQYGSLAEIVNHANEIPGKVGEYFRAAIANFEISKKLCSIDCNTPLTEKIEELIIKPPMQEELARLFQELEFKSWLAELDKNKKITPPIQTSYQLILAEQDFQKLLLELEHIERFALDTETTSLNYLAAELVGISIDTGSQNALYIPLAHDYSGAPTQLSRNWVLQKLKPILENPNIQKIGQNIKYDCHILANYGIELQGIEFDTMLESYVLNSVATRHDMDSLALHYLNRKTITFEEIAGRGAKQLHFNEIDVETAKNYAAEDAEVTRQLHDTLWPQIAAKPLLKHVYQNIEKPLIRVLFQMERNGVLVDASALQQQSQEIAVKIDKLEQDAYKEAGTPFNLQSPKQLQEILFEKLKIPIIQKTPTGQPSTSENVLQDLSHDYALPKLILEYRSLSKLKSTYLDKLPEQISPKTQRVHTSYHQAIAATGRLSSSDPNLQNIPTRSEEGRRIRQAFIAPTGYSLLSADYSQIELRIMAHLSQDQALQQAFANGLDIHAATASEVFGVTIADVSQEERRRAKAINFGLIYGMSAFGLAKQLGISRHEAQLYVDKYFERYPGVKNYMERTRALAKSQGFVQTLSGRRLYLPDISAKNFALARAAERTAINAPMQGTAADLIKLAMIALHNAIFQHKLDAKMIMQVHDELVLEVANRDIAKTSDLVRHCMTEAISLSVPLVVDIGVGTNWDEAH